MICLVGSGSPFRELEGAGSMITSRPGTNCIIVFLNGLVDFGVNKILEITVKNCALFEAHVSMKIALEQVRAV